MLGLANAGCAVRAVRAAVCASARDVALASAQAALGVAAGVSSPLARIHYDPASAVFVERRCTFGRATVVSVSVVTGDAGSSAGGVASSGCALALASRFFASFSSCFFFFASSRWRFSNE